MVGLRNLFSAVRLRPLFSLSAWYRLGGMCVYPENRGQKRDVGGLNLPGTVIIIAGSTTLHDFGSIFVLCRYRLGWDLFGHLSATEENIMDYDVLVVGGER